MLSTRLQSLTRKVAAKLTNFLGASNSVINISPTCELPHATTIYLINQTPGKKLRHGVALRASAALVESCELLSQ